MHCLRRVLLLALPFLITACATPGPSGTEESAPRAEPASAEPSSVATAKPAATLSALRVTPGRLDQSFQPAADAYTAGVGFLVSRVRIRATATDPAARISIDGAPWVGAEAETGIALPPGRRRVEVGVAARDGSGHRLYTIELDRETKRRFSQRAYLKASNADSNDLFGYSMALSGDTLVVGAYLEDGFATGVDGNQADNSADGSGAVYVFVRHGGSWLQQAYIKASNTRSGDQFGRAVAISGDTLIVGAPFQGGAGRGIDPPDDGVRAPARVAESGAAYVFRRSAGVWRQEAYIKASNARPGDLFGSSVAVSGTRLAVGAWMEDSAATGIGGDGANAGAENSGAVYLYSRTRNGWSEEAYVKSSLTRAGDRFGYSLALADDLLAVGAYARGSVHLYRRGSQGWSAEAHLTAPAGAHALFGSSLALSGDTLIAGAPLEDAGDATGSRAQHEGAGAVHVFVRRNGEWSRQAWLKAPPGAAGHRFGQSVAIDGDTLAVGAYLDDRRARGIDAVPEGIDPESGAAYVFTRSNGDWSQQAWVKSSNARRGDMFGYSLALSGEWLAVGAPIEASGARGVDGNQTDAGAPGSGAVYVFR